MSFFAILIDLESCLIFLGIQEWAPVKKFPISISILNLFVDKITYFEKQVKVMLGHENAKKILLAQML